MADEIVYMLGIIGVGFLVNYTLRALPFLLFSGRDRALPRWVEKLGGVLSPVIIALLIVYAYAGSAWRTPWPYLAGVVTVGLQVWKRNPLLSIVAGTALYMALLNCCGCATRTVRNLDDSNPELQMRADGVYMGERSLAVDEIVEALEAAEIPRTRAIHIKVAADAKSLSASRALMKLLARAGYTRSILVTEQHDASNNKSGDAYRGNERMQRREDVMFTVTRGGVRFGLLTPVEPSEVVACLTENNVLSNQLIRICAKVEDFGAKSIVSDMAQLEAILRKAGYANLVRCWIGDPKGVKLPQQNRSARTPTSAIRYKSSEED